jgi:hypothetical protein
VTGLVRTTRAHVAWVDVVAGTNGTQACQEGHAASGGGGQGGLEGYASQAGPCPDVGCPSGGGNVPTAMANEAAGCC